MTQPPASAPVRPSRPRGITILGVLGIVAGLFWGFVALLALVIGSLLGALLGGAIGGDAGAGAGAALGIVLGLLFLALAVVALVSGIGLLAGKKWGWYLGLAWAALQVVQALVSFASFEPFSGTLGGVIGAIVGWYLLSPRVQAWFGVSHRVPWRYKDAAV